jgi:hypothetical protein
MAHQPARCPPVCRFAAYRPTLAGLEHWSAAPAYAGRHAHGSRVEHRRSKKQRATPDHTWSQLGPSRQNHILFSPGSETCRQPRRSFKCRFSHLRSTKK